MSIGEYDAVYALLHLTPGIRLRAADSREMIEQYLVRNPGMSFVARSGNRIVGCVISGHDGRRGYLYHLAVAPDVRRRGVASRLVASCLDKLAEAGIDKIHVQVVVENDVAHDFWADRGWQRRTDIVMYSFTNGTNPDL
jgi:ribosomal protein S18 acetylase RimI-like enzyme